MSNNYVIINRNEINFELNSAIISFVLQIVEI